MEIYCRFTINRKGCTFRWLTNLKFLKSKLKFSWERNFHSLISLPKQNHKFANTNAELNNQHSIPRNTFEAVRTGGSRLKARGLRYRITSSQRVIRYTANVRLQNKRKVRPST